MKKKVYIKFDAHNIPGKADAILNATGCGPDVADVSDLTGLGYPTVTVRIALDAGDERVAKVLALLEQYRVEVESLQFTEYTEEDRQRARLLLMRPSSGRFQIDAGLSLGTDYDMVQACAECGTGAKQISPLYVGNIRKIRLHPAIASFGGDILVDRGLVNKLKESSVTGISFGEVRMRHKDNTWTKVTRDQILIARTMPPMRGELTAKDKRALCQYCQRGGWIAPTDIVYREEDLVGLQDFNLTWEWFGEFRPADRRNPEIRSRPRVLVTPKVMNLFLDAGVNSFQWTPVGIEG